VCKDITYEMPNEPIHMPSIEFLLGHLKNVFQVSIVRFYKSGSVLTCVQNNSSTNVLVGHIGYQVEVMYLWNHSTLEYLAARSSNLSFVHCMGLCLIEGSFLDPTKSLYSTQYWEFSA